MSVDNADALAALAYFRERISSASVTGAPLRLRGGGSKDFYGEMLVGNVLDTRSYRGIVNYDPSELIVTARCGTPLAEIEDVLAAHAQFLPFEAPMFDMTTTLGGAVAAGLSGPRRVSTGAIRDFVLGATLLNAHSELLHFGGEVMKNVAGFDVSRLLCGSLGVLGLITRVSLKVMPQPRSEITVQFACDAAEALARFDVWRARPLPISASVWHSGILRVRLTGALSAVREACETLGGDRVEADAAAAQWRTLRNQTQEFFVDSATPLWRLSVPATTPLAACAGDLIEWSGALRWLRSALPAAQIRAATQSVGGTATCWKGPREAPMFHPLAPTNLALQHRLKAQFDPHRIFNRDRLVIGL